MGDQTGTMGVSYQPGVGETLARIAVGVLAGGASPTLPFSLVEQWKKEDAAKSAMYADPAYQAILAQGGPQAAQALFGVRPPEAIALEELQARPGLNTIAAPSGPNEPTTAAYQLPPTTLQLAMAREALMNQAAPPGFEYKDSIFTRTPGARAAQETSGRLAAELPYTLEEERRRESRDLAKEGREEARATWMANMAAARQHLLDTGDDGPLRALEAQASGSSAFSGIEGKSQRDARLQGERAAADAARKARTLTANQQTRLDQLAVAETFVQEWENVGLGGKSSLPAKRVGGSGDASLMGRLGDVGSALSTRADQAMATVGRDPFFVEWERLKALARPILARNLGGDVGNLSETEQKAIDAVTSALSQPEVEEAAALMRRLIEGRRKELTAGKTGAARADDDAALGGDDAAILEELRRRGLR